MALESLTLNVIYHVKDDRYEARGNVKPEFQEEIVSTFLRGQIGKGKDGRQYSKRKVYNIQLKLYPRDDRIEATSDTGNDSLRDGLLIGFLKSLRN